MLDGASCTWFDICLEMGYNGRWLVAEGSKPIAANQKLLMECAGR